MNPNRPDQPMVILVNHTFDSSNGQGRVNRGVADYAAEAGHALILIGADVPDALASRVNVRWIRVDAPQWLPAPLRYQVFAWRAWRAIRRVWRPGDVLHLNGAMTYPAADVNACHFVHSAWLRSAGHDWALGRDWRGAYQRLVTWLNACWERLAYRQATRIVAVSELVRDDLVRFAKVEREKITVIPNGVDCERFQPAATAAPAPALPTPGGGGGGPLRIGFCGGVKTRRKNLDLVLQAVARLDERFTLTVAGAYEGGPYPEMIRSLGLRQRVQLLGSIQDPAAFYHTCDVLVLASHYEPWGLVIGEAMASGLPVIVAPSVGASCVVRHGDNGLVIGGSHDLEGLVQALRRLAEQPAERAALATRARQTAETLSWNQVAERYRRLYNAEPPANPTRLTPASRST